LTDLEILEELLLTMHSMGGGLRVVEGPSISEPSLKRYPELATAPHHFVLWYPKEDEPDGEMWSTFPNLKHMITQYRMPIEVIRDALSSKQT
jgi:hypothetical protein